MAETPSPNQRRYPSVAGAGLVAGLFAGAAMGGALGGFGFWIPLLGVVGLIVGLLLQAYGGERPA